MPRQRAAVLGLAVGFALLPGLRAVCDAACLPGPPAMHEAHATSLPPAACHDADGHAELPSLPHDESLPDDCSHEAGAETPALRVVAPQEPAKVGAHTALLTLPRVVATVVAPARALTMLPAQPIIEPFRALRI